MKLGKPTTTNTYNQPWSVVDDVELASLREIAAQARMLKRGCHCSATAQRTTRLASSDRYDYRCGNCQTIINILELVDTARSSR